MTTDGKKINEVMENELAFLINIDSLTRLNAYFNFFLPKKKKKMFSNCTVGHCCLLS